jgi:hypothetical protein
MLNEPQSIADRVIKPNQWVFGVGIPTSIESFFGDQEREEDRFARRYRHRGWEAYENDVVSHMSELHEMGLRIIPDLTLGDFNKALADPTVAVFTLLSHWREDDAIEFREGFADREVFVSHVPEKFAGVIDLCICLEKKEKLIPELRKRRPRCLPRHTKCKATPALWLSFYQVLYDYVRDYDVSYLQALEIVTKGFLGTLHRSEQAQS